MERRVLSPNIRDDASTPSIVQTAGSPLTNRAAMLYNRGPQYQGGLRSLVAPPRTPVGGEADRQKLMDMQRQAYRNFLTQNQAAAPATGTGTTTGPVVATDPLPGAGGTVTMPKDSDFGIGGTANTRAGGQGGAPMGDYAGGSVPLDNTVVSEIGQNPGEPGMLIGTGMEGMTIPTDGAGGLDYGLPGVPDPGPASTVDMPRNRFDEPPIPTGIASIPTPMDDGFYDEDLPTIDTGFGMVDLNFVPGINTNIQPEDIDMEAILEAAQAAAPELPGPEEFIRPPEPPPPAEVPMMPVSVGRPPADSLPPMPPPPVRPPLPPPPPPPPPAGPPGAMPGPSAMDFPEDASDRLGANLPPDRQFGPSLPATGGLGAFEDMSIPTQEELDVLINNAIANIDIPTIGIGAPPILPPTETPTFMPKTPRRPRGRVPGRFPPPGLNLGGVVERVQSMMPLKYQGLNTGGEAGTDLTGYVSIDDMPEGSTDYDIEMQRELILNELMRNDLGEDIVDILRDLRDSRQMQSGRARSDADNKAFSNFMKDRMKKRREGI